MAKETLDGITMRVLLKTIEEFKNKCSLVEHRKRNDFCREYSTNYTVPYSKGLKCINSNNLINEGLIKTYPTKTLIRKLIDGFRNNGVEVTEKHFHVDMWDKDETIANYIGFFIPDYIFNSSLNNTLKKIIDLCGYYIAWAGDGIHGKYNGTVFQIEPKFQEDKIEMGQYLYHITTANKANKILKNGFYPKNANQTSLNYSPRVYFFITDDKRVLLSYIFESKKLSTVGKETKREFVIFKIDRTQIENVKFFKDPNVPNDYAIFTYEYIPPTAIVDTETISV